MSIASKNSITISSIEFAELLAKICKITGKSAGSHKHHWQFMRFIRRHRGKVLQQVGETVKLTRLRRHKNSKFSEVAMLSEKQVIEYIKIHKSTKGVAEEIEKKLKSMSGFAPLAEKLRFVRDDLKGVVVDPIRLAEVKKQCLKIPVLKDRKQLIFSKVKDGQLLNGCAAITKYTTHYTLISYDYEEEYLPKSEYSDLGIEEDGEEYIIKTYLTETRSSMTVQAGAVVKIVNVHAADPRYFECRMFLYGSDMAIVLIHYSALAVLDISMRREVIKLINETGLCDFCELFDVVGKVENKKIVSYSAK